MSLYRWRQAAAVLREGGLIAYPTEGVYGLGCNPFDYSSVCALLELKNRPIEKGLILAAGDISFFSFLLNQLQPEEIKKITASWPGPVTWVIPHFGLIPHWISGGKDSVAIRVSRHSAIKGISYYFKSPIVSTSANFSGLAPARSYYQLKTMRKKLNYIVPGRLLTPGVPSIIVDLRSGCTLRG